MVTGFGHHVGLPHHVCIGAQSIVAELLLYASIHHVDAVVACIQNVGALVRFLPPYSPDLNPIESVFGEVKQYLQANDILA